MREIKFRAWIKTSELGNTVNAMAYHESYILLGWKWEDETDMILMQYTGLKDNSGKKIYEGDILSNKWKVEVYQHRNTGAYMIKFHNNPKMNKVRSLYEYLKGRELAGTSDEDNIVIGDIYQNPELLK